MSGAVRLSCECNDEIIVQATHAILGYLFEVGHIGLYEVDNGDVWNAFARRVNVLVGQYVAITDCANLHNGSHNILTIRVKYEGLKCQEGAFNKATIAHFDLLVII